MELISFQNDILRNITLIKTALLIKISLTYQITKFYAAYLKEKCGNSLKTLLPKKALHRMFSFCSSAY